MTTQNIGLFKALAAKMEYLDQRQRVIAQNIANADTPEYQPKDLKAVDFSAMLNGSRSIATVTPAITSPMHIGAAEDTASAQSRDEKNPYEVSPAGNAVILEEQMIKSGQNMMDYNLITNLYQKNMSMMRVALGRGG